MGFKNVKTQEEEFLAGARGDEEKRKRGRPFGTTQKKSKERKTVSMTLTQEEYMRLKKQAEDNGLPMAAYMKHTLLYKNFNN